VGEKEVQYIKCFGAKKECVCVSVCASDTYVTTKCVCVCLKNVCLNTVCK
jgi:hypothetical protein